MLRHCAVRARQLQHRSTFRNSVVRPVFARSFTMPKRKLSSIAASTSDTGAMPPPPAGAAKPARRPSHQKPSLTAMNPDETSQVIDGPEAMRASPDGDVNDYVAPADGVKEKGSESPLSDAPDVVERPKKKQQSASSRKAATTPQKKDDKMTEMMAASSARKSALKAQRDAEGGNAEPRGDPEADDLDEEADPEEIKEALSRPPPINSDYLPLPWKGRIGYACLCTYLRYSNPPVFSSRTTRIASILEHRHPLKDPSQPEHSTKNRPDKDQPPDVRRGMEFVEQLGLANTKDMIKMLRWNERYGIKFMRLSSETFPFASHAEYGYKLEPFAADALAEVGKVVAELGHRVTTHPGQFTQLGSPRPEVITSSFRDLEYHDEMLSLLKLPEQQDRDAVMILHMGGVFGDKEATLNRFRENYKTLAPSIKKRLVLENDDVSWSVHDLLPVCKELDIPFVLDFHHHNIIFDETKIREGTKDIMALYPEIRETWDRKGITMKMHYSEPTPAALTRSQRRKHNPRVATLPPCPPDVDLMIEAKDKEQAVFELMRTFKLPGFDRFNDMIPHIRRDDNKPVRLPAALKNGGKKTPKKGKGKKAKEEDEEDEETGGVKEEEEESTGQTAIPEEEVGMGGPENRVYWPPGMEDWLRPVKKVVKKKEAATPAKPKSIEEMKAAKAEKVAQQSVNAPDGAAAAAEGDEAATAAPAKKGGKKKGAAKGKQVKTEPESEPTVNGDTPAVNGLTNGDSAPPKKAASKRKSTAPANPPKKVKKEPTPTTSDEEADEIMAEDMERDVRSPPALKRGRSSRKSSRAKPAEVSYNEEGSDEDDER